MEKKKDDKRNAVDYDVKRPNFTFYGVPERKTTIFISFSKLSQGPLEFKPEKRTSPAFGKLNEML